MLFHIGYHKTGTTFLQEALFESTEFFYRVPQREIFLSLIFPHDLEFDRDRAAAFVNSYRDRGSNGSRVAVFSNERLSGSPHSGGYDSLQIAERIRSCAPDAKILIFVREQKSMLLSMYAQYVKGVGCMSLREYCDSQHINHRKELFKPVFLEFDRLVAEYQGRFDQVLVLPFEWLKTEPVRVISQVIGFSGVSPDCSAKLDVSTQLPRNVSRSASLQRMDRFLHPLRSRSIPHVGGTYYFALGRLLSGAVLKGSSYLPLDWLDRRLRRKDLEFVDAFIADRYSDSNRRLSSLTGIDLTELGYS